MFYFFWEGHFASFRSLMVTVYTWKRKQNKQQLVQQNRVVKNSFIYGNSNGTL